MTFQLKRTIVVGIAIGVSWLIVIGLVWSLFELFVA